MVGIYPLTGKKGTVRVSREGLYYRFSCRYADRGGEIQRLVAVTNHGRLDLGICVPMEGGFGVDKRLSCAQAGDGVPKFYLVSAATAGGIFVPVYPHEPFAYISKLKGSFLEIRDGKPGVVIRK